MKKALLCSIAATSIIYSGAAFAQNQAQVDQNANSCDRLVAYIDKNRGLDLDFDRDDVLEWRQAGTVQRCDAQLAQLEKSGEAAGETDGRIVVEQTAPAIRIDQAEPQITVQQPQPDVSVAQGRPEIIVRQPAPQVTINIPQPEITVRMPEPEVNVSQAQPRVQVTQPEPEVDVVQSDQARVMLEQDEQPQVRVERSQEQANVQVQRSGQPQVRYEAEEPQIRIQRAEGQPDVRYEQLNRETAEAGQETQQRTQQQQQVVEREAETRTDQAFQAARTAETEATETTGAVQPGNMRTLTAEELQGMDVVNARGEQLGDVENLVLSTSDNRTMAIVAHGGFLGLGEKKVALPLENMALADDRLVIRGVTDEQLKAMPAWEEGDANYRAVTGTEPAEIEAAE